jgi:hypothetical protein
MGCFLRPRAISPLLIDPLTFQLVRDILNKEPGAIPGVFQPLVAYACWCLWMHAFEDAILLDAAHACCVAATC